MSCWLVSAPSLVSPQDPRLTGVGPALEARPRTASHLDPRAVDQMTPWATIASATLM